MPWDGYVSSGKEGGGRRMVVRSEHIRLAWLERYMRYELGELEDQAARLKLGIEVMGR